jgi:hypothetical protein
MRLAPHVDALLDLVVEVAVARALAAEAGPFETETPGKLALPGAISTTEHEHQTNGQSARTALGPPTN